MSAKREVVGVQRIQSLFELQDLVSKLGMCSSEPGMSSSDVEGVGFSIGSRHVVFMGIVFMAHAIVPRVSEVVID